MNKQIKIFLTGLLVLIPFAITVWIIWILAQWLGGLGYSLVGLIGPLRDALWDKPWLWSIIGVVMVLVGIYLIGLLMSLVLFRRMFGWLDRVMNRLPGVNIIYQAVRDMVKLFDGSSSKMGKVVMYRPAGSQMEMLGILTNENPPGVNAPGKPKRVCVYVPFGLAIGGVALLRRTRRTAGDRPARRAGHEAVGHGERRRRNSAAADKDLKILNDPVPLSVCDSACNWHMRHCPARRGRRSGCTRRV
ncbi:MAG: DUF502 domain-containing protein [Planctomycetes bacterium]|nr:DUF502 domain-containing protein [Planctomycetota bacterium]